MRLQLNMGKKILCKLLTVLIGGLKVVLLLLRWQLILAKKIPKEYVELEALLELKKMLFNSYKNLK